MKIRRVGLLLNFTDCYDLDVARGVLRFAKERGNWRLFSQGWMFNPIEDLSNWDGDGAIARVHELWPYGDPAKLRMPLVDVAGTEDHADYAQVTNDDHVTGFIAGKHLLECGFANLAFLGVRNAGWSLRRLRGIEQAAAENGVQIQRREVDSRWSWDKGKFSRLEGWLRRLPKPCGLLAADDALAFKALQAAQAAGLSVPGGLAVVGVGNEDVLREIVEPSLTSIPCDCQRIGYEAAARLECILNGDSPARGEPLRIPPKPILHRESTNTVAGVDASVAKAIAFIKGHIQDGINVTDVVKNVDLCRRSLENRFRTLLGRSIHDEITRARMEAACRLLESGAGASETAKKVGFATTHHFHYTFKDYYGITPLIYSRLLESIHSGRAYGGDGPG